MQITTKALKQMVNSQIMVQLKHGLIMVHGQRGVPEPLEVKLQDGTRQMVVVPFLCGKLVDRDDVLLLEYMDSSSGRAVELLLSTDELVSVARLVEQRLITPSSGL